jgi:hypothetical protein
VILLTDAGMGSGSSSGSLASSRPARTVPAIAEVTLFVRD